MPAGADRVKDFSKGGGGGVQKGVIYNKVPSFTGCN